MACWINTDFGTTTATRLVRLVFISLAGLVSADASLARQSGFDDSRSPDTQQSLTTADSTTFSVEAPIGGPFPETQRLIVLENKGPSSLRWIADSTGPGFRFSQSGGHLAAGGREAVVVSLDPFYASSLAAGEYTADILFRNARDTEDRVVIRSTLTLFETSAAGSLLVTPREDFEPDVMVESAVTTPTRVYRVTNSGAEPVQFSIKSSEPWVTFSGDSGGNLATGEARSITVSIVDELAARLGPGSHRATIEFTNATNGAGSATRCVELIRGPTDDGSLAPGIGYLSVNPAGDYSIRGTVGGDFTPASKTYTLSNRGGAPLEWRVSVGAPWLEVAGQRHGFLNPQRSTTVTLQVDQAAVRSFAVGDYQAVATFKNLTTGRGTSRRDVFLTVESGGGGDGGKPGPTNTGPYDESILTPMNGMTITTNGYVLENVDISGSILIRANNVTIRNFRIDANGEPYGIECVQNYSGLLAEDGEIIDAESCGVYGKGFIARRLEVHQGGRDAFKAHGDALIEDCWMHHLGMSSGAHADGDQSLVGMNITIRHNNIDMPIGIPGHESNSALSISAYYGATGNVLIERNWLNGGNFTLFLTDDAYGPMNNVRLIDNRFGRGYRYGVLFNDTSTVISGNVWDDTGELMDIND